MLDVLGSIQNLQWTTEHHFLHVKARHPFMRAIAVQFELAYTDFRTIQLALQLAEEQELLKKFTSQYNEVFKYEMSFTRGDLAGFDQDFPDGIAAYQKAQSALLETLVEITKKQPVTGESKALI